MTVRAAAATPVMPRVERHFRIAELIRRYKAELDGKRWRFRDLETGTLSVADYDDEGMAGAGARLATACDIDELYGAKS